MKITIVCYKYSVDIQDPCCYPLGFMYVSAALKNKGHEVKVLNYNLWDYDFAEEIKNQHAVLFTGFEEFRPYIKRDAAIARSMGVKTVLGGALATFCTDEMSQHVDVVVIGEAESEIEHAIAAIGVYRCKPVNINSLPLPDYDGFGIEEYHRRHTVRYMGVLTSRGCPYSCRFCAQTCRFQKRSIEHVSREIEHYKQKYKIDSIVFNDNTLNLGKERWMKLCAEMKRYKLFWGGAIRLDGFDEEMAIAAKTSGVHALIVGVESFKQSKLDLMNKRIKVDKIEKTLDILNKHKINYHGNILVGFPNESYSDIVAEIESMPKKYNVFPAVVQPFVGTHFKTRNIDEYALAALNKKCKEYANQRGKEYYTQ